MDAQLRVRHLPAAPGGEWARIDPIVYVAEARRLQARAVGEAIGAGWRGLRRALTGVTGLVRRHLLEPIERRGERRRAVAHLAALDDRLLADIGLRRGDIELTVDGRLADPRVTRWPPVAATAVADRLLEGGRVPEPAASANANRPAPGLAA
jgi:uncharacterized protein YjiS (DUF1127 family)